MNELEDKFGSRYDLVLLAANRAKQLQAGAPPLIRTTSSNPLTIALEEIASGKYPRSEEEMRRAEKPEVHAFLPELVAVKDEAEPDGKPSSPDQPEEDAEAE